VVSNPRKTNVVDVVVIVVPPEPEGNGIDNKNVVYEPDVNRQLSMLNDDDIVSIGASAADIDRNAKFPAGIENLSVE
jgi:hypothetical protein